MTRGAYPEPMRTSSLLLLVGVLWSAVALCDQRSLAERTRDAQAAAARGDFAALDRALSDEALAVRRVAGEGLARLGPAGLQRLLDAAQSESYRTQQAARRGLRHVEPRTVVAAVQSVCALLKGKADSPARELLHLGARLPNQTRGELGWALARREEDRRDNGPDQARLELRDDLRRLGAPALDACAAHLGGGGSDELQAALRGVAAFGSAAKTYEADVVALVASHPEPAIRTLADLGAWAELRRLSARSEFVDTTVWVLGESERGRALALELALDPERSLDLRARAVSALLPSALSPRVAPRLLKELRSVPPGDLQQNLSALALERGLLVAELARHPDAEVRGQVVSLLEEQPQRLGLLPDDLLRALVADDQELPGLRGAALRGLALRGVPEARALARTFLQAPQAELQVAGAKVAALLRDEPSLPHVVKALGGARAPAQAAEESLARWGAAACKALAPLLASPNDELRLSALRVLGRSEPPAFGQRDALRTCLGHAHLETRLGAVDALAALAQRDGRLSDLEPALGDASGEVRAKAGAALAADPQAVLEALAAEPEAWVRDTLIRRLAGRRSARDALLTLSEHPERSLRLKALAELIGRAPSRNAELGARVLKAIEDAPREAGQLIDRALVPLAPHLSLALRARAGRVLAGLALDQFGTPTARARCLVAFADQAGALEHLRSDLGSGDVTRREAAASELAAVGSRAAPAVVDLVDRLGDPGEDERVRVPAAEALGGVPEAAELSVPALLELLDSPRAKERAAAVKALGSLGKAARAAEGALADLAADPDEQEHRALALRALAAVSSSSSREAGHEALGRYLDETAPLDEAELWLVLGEERRALELVKRAGAEGGGDSRRATRLMARCGARGFAALRERLLDPSLSRFERRLSVSFVARLRGAERAACALLSQLARDPDPALRAAVLEALRWIAEREAGVVTLTPDLLACFELAEVNDECARQVRLLVGLLGPRAAAALPLMLRWLKAPEGRAFALDLIRQLGKAAAAGEGVVGALEPLARVGEPHAGRAALALLALEGRRLETLVPVLRWALPRSPRRVALGIAGVLGRAGGDGAEEGLRHLLRCLDDLDASVYEHVEALDGLRHHGAGAPRDVVEALAADRDLDPMLREAAQRTLRTLPE